MSEPGDAESVRARLNAHLAGEGTGAGSRPGASAGSRPGASLGSHPGPRPEPLLLRGDAAQTLRLFPDASVDCVVTSPPYFGHRRYANGGIGAEASWQDYVAAIGAVTEELLRVVKLTGSLWLNVGDTYRGKRLLGVPWRVAFHLTDEQGWTLRNSVVWHKVKGGPDTSRDKLRNVHELVFHFVRRPKGYYYDADAVRRAPRAARVENGVVVSATGVSGVRYRRQLELSTALSASERAAAGAALDDVLADVREGRLADFRMVIRGQQRATHSDAAAVSGRARELQERGFYFLRYHPGGSKPGDVWDILPEDSHGRGTHFAPFPADLCRIPLLATCPQDGLVLDPFCGTGTALVVARELGRRSVGIDLCDEYLEIARGRTAPA